MDKGHLGGGGGGLLALDASPRPLGFLNLLSPPAPFHRSSMEADDGGGGGGRGRRSVEVDFFSDEKKNMKKTRVSASAADAEEQKSQADGLAIKKEDLTINLLPGNNNARSDRSMVVDDDAASRRHEEGRNNTELAAMQSELSRLNEENQRLRGMLTQVTNSYQALQMHLVALMQQRTQQLPPTRRPDSAHSHHVGRRVHAALGLHAQRRRVGADELQLPGAHRAAVLLQHGHHLRVRAVPDGHARPHPRPARPAQRPAAQRRPAARAGAVPDSLARRRDGPGLRDAAPHAVQPVQVLRPADVVRRVRGCRRRSAVRAAQAADGPDIRHRQRGGGGHHRGPELHGGARGGHHVDHRRAARCRRRQQHQHQQ